MPCLFHRDQSRNLGPVYDESDNVRCAPLRCIRARVYKNVPIVVEPLACFAGMGINVSRKIGMSRVSPMSLMDKMTLELPVVLSRRLRFECRVGGRDEVSTTWPWLNNAIDLKSGR